MANPLSSDLPWFQREPPTDPSWFNLKRYESCKQWGPETWLRVLRGRAFLYEWAKGQRDAIGSRQFRKVIGGIPAQYLEIFREPQEYLDDEAAFKAWREFECGHPKPRVRPLSLRESRYLSGCVMGYERRFMEPVYHYASRGKVLPKGCRDCLDGFKIPDKQEREKIAKLLGSTGPESISEGYAFPLSQLDEVSIDELAYLGDLYNGSLHPAGRCFNLAHLTIDLNADDELLKRQFAACLDDLRRRLDWQSVENIATGDVNKKLPKRVMECDFEEWHRGRLLPFLDISIFSWVSGNLLTDEDLLEYLFFHQQSTRVISRTRANAEAIITKTVLQALEARVYSLPE